MIQGMFDGGALPVLSRVIQFTVARHRVLAHDIANLSTPHFEPLDLDPKRFGAALADALDRRRRGPGSAGGPLEIRRTNELEFGPETLEVRPQPARHNILFHDRNNRDLERTMQHLVENTFAHNLAVEFIRSEVELLRTAIRERV